MAKENSTGKLISRREAAEFLGVKPQTLATWASTKRYGLPYIKFGTKVRYSMNHLVEFARVNTHGAHERGAE